MFKSKIPSAAFVFALAITGAAAQADQAHRAQTQGGFHHGASPNAMQPMANGRQMGAGAKHGDMMQMHGQMAAMMGDTLKHTEHMLDRDVMRLMHGALAEPMKASDGMAPGEAVHTALQALLKGADGDGDGNLTLEEFEDLHGQLLRTRMVDRFQHLDADGDGRVSTQEMIAPSNRMMSHMPGMGMIDKMQGKATKANP